MIPTLGMGVIGEGPEFEVSRAELYPILAVMALEPPLLGDDEAAGWHALASTDFVLLNERNVPFFSRLQDTCRSISSGNRVRYDYDKIVGSSFEYILTSLSPAGEIAPSAVGAARRILQFLAENPAHWPK